MNGDLRYRALLALALATVAGLANASWACQICAAVGEDLHVLPAFESGQSNAPAGSSVLTALAVPIYSSLPAASAKVYLDFDGDVTSNWGGYSPGTTPAYDTDGDASTFSATELQQIHEIWSRVSESFSPFNLDVTTVDPGALIDRQALRIVIGGDGKNGAANYWVGQKAGGIAFIGGFYDADPNTVYVFPGNLAGGAPKPVADAVAHEAGHAFGLYHQSVYDAAGAKTLEYNPGTADKAPLMGRSYESIRGLWWYGASLAASLYQDDLPALASSINGFGYRADDHGDVPAAATPLSLIGESIAATGVIENVEDLDLFSMTIPDSHVYMSLTGAPFGAMLDPSLMIYDSAGAMIAEAATASLTETLFAWLPAGSYWVGVGSAGGYGDIGQYFLSGSVAAIPEPLGSAVMAVLLGLSAGSRRAGRKESSTLRAYH